MIAKALLSLFPNWHFANQLSIRIIFHNPAAGDPSTIAGLVVSCVGIELRRFLLGESVSALWSVASGAHRSSLVLHLSQSRWHRFARLLTGRASFHRRWIQLHGGSIEPRSGEFSDLGRTV